MESMFQGRPIQDIAFMIIAAAVAFLTLREVVIWYLKINRMVTALEKIEGHLYIISTNLNQYKRVRYDDEIEYKSNVK